MSVVKWVKFADYRKKIQKNHPSYQKKVEMFRRMYYYYNKLKRNLQQKGVFIMDILVINAGSSSLKFQLINMENEEVLARVFVRELVQMVASLLLSHILVFRLRTSHFL